MIDVAEAFFTLRRELYGQSTIWEPRQPAILDVLFGRALLTPDRTKTTAREATSRNHAKNASVATAIGVTRVDVWLA